jgi:trans-aconitate 2-methyltransferase
MTAMAAPPNPPPAEWDASTYHRVSAPQVRWGSALLGEVELRGDELAVDAGCGTGRLTERLLARLPGGRVIGIDRSRAMVVQARRHLTAAGTRFGAVQADLCDLPVRSDAVDLVFSTATFHWITDHDRLFGEVARVLRGSGRLVAQCGGVGNVERVHDWARQAMALPGLAPNFAGWVDPWNYPPTEECARRLRAAGLRVERVGQHEELTVLDGPDAFAEFSRTVVLRPFLARLPTASQQDRFVAAVTARAAAAQPPWSLDYVRLTMFASKPARQSSQEGPA